MIAFRQSSKLRGRVHVVKFVVAYLSIYHLSHFSADPPERNPQNPPWETPAGLARGVGGRSWRHPVRNGYLGEENKFEFYNGSKSRSAVEPRSGQSVTFPDLADRVSDDIYIKGMSIAVAIKELPLGNRAALMGALKSRRCWKE